MKEIPWKTLTILVVDDEPAQLRLYTHAVKMLGVKRIVTAEDGADALAKVNLLNGNVDVVITDVDMPTMNGIEFVKELRAHSDLRTSKIPVLVITNHRESTVVTQAAELAIQGFLIKPITEAMLKLRIAKALTRRG